MFCQSPLVTGGLLSAGGLRNTKTQAGWSGCCSLERHQFRGQHKLFWRTVHVWVEDVCACMPAYARMPVCEHVCVLMHFGVGLHTAQNGSQRTGSFGTGPLWTDGERERERDDDEGRRRWADGVQQGWSSLLMKSHLRPPFTLNMGHCSCPDLGFDPQRCLTPPTIPPELPPPPPPLCHLDSTHTRMHMYTYVHTPTFIYIYAMHAHVCRPITTCTCAHTGVMSLDSPVGRCCVYTATQCSFHQQKIIHLEGFLRV